MSRVLPVPVYQTASRALFAVALQYYPVAESHSDHILCDGAIVQDCGLWKLTPNRNTGMRLDATMMVDLMFIACNEGSHHVMPTLLECDETYTKLLTEPGPGPVAVRMADDLARDQHSSQQEDLAQAPSPLPPHAQQQQQQRHAVASEQQPAHLVDQLLMTCLAADHVHLLQIAVNAPAARRLGK